MPNKTSQHILTTAANLLGFCLFVITSLRISNTSTNSLVDEFTSIIALLLALSCIFSFVSIKTKNEVTEKRLESIADFLFLTSLIGIAVIIVLLVFKFVQ